MMAAVERMTSSWWSGVLALVAGAAVAAGGHGVTTAAAARTPEPLGPGVVTVPIGIEHSRFSTDTIRVRPGTTVRFVVDNDDPIHHELVVGPSEVHEQHERGTELAHPPVPGEVSLGPQETGMTFAQFDVPGEVTFACHLPGHVAYGMVGTIEVIG